MHPRQQPLALPTREVSRPPDSSFLLSEQARRPRLWLAIRLPWLPLEVFPSEAGQACAVASGDGGHSRVLICNEAAREQGIRPGQLPNAAFALEPTLHLLERSPWREQQALQDLAGWAGQYTPRVSLEPPDGLLLEIHGSLGLFGGLDALWSALERGLGEQGYQAQLAAAPTAQAAWWLARAATGERVTCPKSLAGMLGRLPLARLGWPSRTVQTLEEMGLQRVGDCLRLPRDGFARRLGPERLAELDRALGRTPETRTAWSAPRRFSVAADLAFECDDSGQLAEWVYPLFERLERYLRVRQSGVRLVELKFYHWRAPATRVVLRLLSAGSQAAHFAALLRERLERTVLPEAVISIGLRSGRLQVVEAVTGRLLERRQGGEAMAPGRLVERLRSRLGRRAVAAVTLHQDHRPERAWRHIEPLGESRPAALPATCRPAWLLDPPQALAQHQGWPRQGGRLRIVAGPERIESGWWDGQDVSRDYYLARNGQQQWLWIYRERQGGRDWYLHGLFA